jgi:hypothetical protein
MSHFTIILQRHSGSSNSDTRLIGDPREGFYAHRGRLRIEASLGNPGLGSYYREDDSFVLVYGRAHWKADFTRQVSERDLSNILEAHRHANNPRLRDLAGNYCLLSYDSQTESLWVGSDFWGTAAPYYGENADRFVIASRAGIVANDIGAGIDGISYLAMMRGATLPSGRTMFDGVKRFTLGQAVRLGGRLGDVEIVSLGALYDEPWRCTFQESVARSIQVLVPAISLAASSPDTMVDLTAGNDTRLTAAALATRRDLGENVRFRVTGDREDPDVQGALKIADLAAWKLEVYPKEVPFGGDLSDLLPVAAAADGSFALLPVANRLVAERRYWATTGHLVGSTCGELFRNWIWQPELLRMGQTPAVNFNALMQHRVRRARDTDIRRLSNGCLSIDEHDDQLLKPYRLLAAMYPQALNTYKLDLMYILQLQNRILWWPLASHVTIEMPYLWKDVTEVSLKLPWQHKRTRRLVTTIVETVAPAIAVVPTDRGAPFQSLRLSTLHSYGAYLLRYTSDIFRRHYLAKAPIPLDKKQKSAAALRADWAAALTSGTLHDDGGVVKFVRTGSTRLSTTQQMEFLTMLSVELLFRLYPRLQRRLTFS